MLQLVFIHQGTFLKFGPRYKKCTASELFSVQCLAFLRRCCLGSSLSNGLGQFTVLSLACLGKDAIKAETG